MDYDQLNTFITLADKGSFSLSAEKLNITQPAVSKRIALLEAQLNCRLFDRVGKTNKLTAAGELTLVRAKKILNESKELRHDIENLTDAVSGKLVISTSHHIGLHRLPPILRTFVGLYPDVELDMRFTDSEIAYYDVLHGDTSLAIATLPSQIDNKNIQIYSLWLDKLVLVCAKNHPLAKLKKLSAVDLEAHNAILPGVETFTRRIIDHYFQSQNLKLPIAFETNYLETIRVMVSSGLGWSILPDILASKELKIISFPALDLTRELGAIVNKNMTLPNSALAMIELLKAQSDFNKLN